MGLDDNNLSQGPVALTDFFLQKSHIFPILSWLLYVVIVNSHSATYSVLI